MDGMSRMDGNGIRTYIQRIRQNCIVQEFGRAIQRGKFVLRLGFNQ